MNFPNIFIQCVSRENISVPTILFRFCLLFIASYSKAFYVLNALVFDFSVLLLMLNSQYFSVLEQMVHLILKLRKTVRIRTR